MSDIRIQKTGEPDILQASDGRLTLSVPIQIKRRSGRQLVTLTERRNRPGAAVGGDTDAAPVGAGQGASLAGHA